MKAEISVISSMRKVLKNEKIVYGEQFMPCLAGNEWESLQIIISANTDVKNYQIVIEDFVDKNGNVFDGEVKIYHQKYLLIDEVLPEEKVNGWVEGWYPDALLPFETAKEYKENYICKNENQGVWVSIHSNSDAISGLYTAKATVILDDEKIDLLLQMKIYNFALPKEIHYNSVYAIGFETILGGEGDHFLATYRKYVDKLVEYKLAPFRFLPDPRPQYITMEEWTNELEYYLDKESQGSYISTFSIPVYADGKYINAEKFQMYVEALYLLSVKRNENLFERGTGVHAGFIDEPHLNKTYDLANSICKNFELVKEQTSNVLREKYGSDEFKERIYKSITEIGNYVTSFFDEKLTEVKNWCPITSKFRNSEDRKKYVEKGKCWWYVCGSGEPFGLNIDHCPLELRMEGWMRDSYSITGCYYWQTTHYYKWVWEQAVHANIRLLIDCYQEPCRCGKSAGDGYLFYPMKPYNLESPVGSIRLEQLRDSAEDYEYLHYLRSLYEKAGQNADNIIKKIQDKCFTDLTVKIDDKGYYLQREEIAKHIEDAKFGKYY